VNPSGTRLAGAGWLWHPYQVVLTFDLAAVRADGRALDRGVGIGRMMASGPITSSPFIATCALHVFDGMKTGLQPGSFACSEEDRPPRATRA
jgi:hypothetical protein